MGRGEWLLSQGVTKQPTDPLSAARAQYNLRVLVARPGRQDPVPVELPAESSRCFGGNPQAGRLFHSSCSAQGPLEGDASEFLDGRVARGSGGLAVGSPGLTSTRREALSLLPPHPPRLAPLHVAATRPA